MISAPKNRLEDEFDRKLDIFNFKRYEEEKNIASLKQFKKP
jgi:hypothetical protein